MTEGARKDLLETARKGISELVADSRLSSFPKDFQYGLRDESCWFFQLHEEQYNLGVESLANGRERGHYSKCVGAASQAEKLLREGGDLASVEEWATRSLEVFREFEKIDPTWHDINPFAATALSVLGRYDEAMAVFRDMFRKQGASDDEAWIAWFTEKARQHKLQREACSG